MRAGDVGDLCKHCTRFEQTVNLYEGLPRSIPKSLIRALGKGKLEHCIVDYFPHIWKKPGAPEPAASIVNNYLSARAHMDAFYQTKISQNMMKALRAFNLPGAL